MFAGTHVCTSGWRPASWKTHCRALPASYTNAQHSNCSSMPPSNTRRHRRPSMGQTGKLAALLTHHGAIANPMRCHDRFYSDIYRDSTPSALRTLQSEFQRTPREPTNVQHFQSSLKGVGDTHSVLVLVKIGDHSIGAGDNRCPKADFSSSSSPRGRFTHGAPLTFFPRRLAGEVL